MTILNFGSVNIDHVYRVAHLVRPGETIASRDYRQFSGGKGFNQSIALARAGATVSHAGRIGADGVWLREQLAADGADVGFLEVIDGPSGHAIIQVEAGGENAIILFGGANRTFTPDDAAEILSHFGPGDWLLLQNEISAMPEILRLAVERGLRIVFNPAPMGAEVLGYPLNGVSIFILNEVEGEAFTGASEADAILAGMHRRFPTATVVLTLGAAGCIYDDGTQRIALPAQKVDVVDTTAAGDTFIGYFLAGLSAGDDPQAALETATRAAAICVTRPGAAPSIPRREELFG
ncbi:MAG: ribokinase [Chloroflexi bacterium]|nr:MAG: ribokinase [Chloroflexota bacterium]